MQSLSFLFSPLFDQIVWQPKRTHGSMLLMEFGEPRLEIVEPRPVGDDGRKECSPHRRRRVYVVGPWSLLVQHCTSRVEAGGKTLTSDEMDDITYRRVLAELNGQRLEAIKVDERRLLLELVFDLGAQLSMWKPDADGLVGLEDEDELWSLGLPDGSNVGLTLGGRVETTPPGK